MRKLGNTLYVTLPDVYLSLDGENIVVLQDGKEVRRIPCTIWKASWCLAIQVQALP